MSATTRARRPGEADGVDYRFLSADRFDRMVAEGAFLEWADVHGARYGTPRAPVEDALRRGKTVILEIDVQGARQVRRSMPGALLVFVEPPSWEVLRERLERRETESPESLRLRLRNAEAELAAAPEFDRVVLNDDLGRAAEELARILEDTRAPGARGAAPCADPPGGDDG